MNEVNVPCPCGNYVHTDNIFFNLENVYTCEKCNNDFKLILNITPTLVTEIVDVNQAVADFAKEAEEIKDVKITSEYTEGTEL